MNRITHLPILWGTCVSVLGIGLLAWGLVAVAPVLAATVTAPLEVTATVAPSCIISTTPLAFGTYDSTSTHLTTPRDAQGVVSFTCTLGSGFAITLGQGLNAATGSTDDIPLRRMISGANFLSYFIYQEVGGTTVWGNTTASDISSTGTGLPQTLQVYGRIPAAQVVPSGSYADTVVATITF